MAATALTTPYPKVNNYELNQCGFMPFSRPPLKWSTKNISGNSLSSSCSGVVEFSLYSSSSLKKHSRHLVTASSTTDNGPPPVSHPLPSVTAPSSSKSVQFILYILLLLWDECG